MRGHRLISILSVGLLASATIVAAQPAKKKAPAKPKDTTAAPATPKDAGSGSGSAVDMPEDPPPKDMEGKDENPGAPTAATVETEVVAQAPPPKPKRVGYPIEEALRPITMPKNMSEVSLGPHAQLDPYAGADALHARFGINDKAQIGVTYLFAGIYDDPATPAMVDDSLGVHGGKAVGLDFTYTIRHWAAARIAVPMYISPFAIALQLGAPLKFTFNDKFAVGGFDDLLTIRLKEFPPTFYQEAQNAAAAEASRTMTQQSRGSLRFSTFGIWQYSMKTAVVGRLGVNVDDFSTTKTGGVGTGLTSFMRLGFDYTIRNYLDLGLSLGFDDLAHLGTFGPAGVINFRI
jgi:hypothetical protein